MHSAGVSKRYIKEFHDRHGRLRRYLRYPGAKQIALPADVPVDSLQFQKAYNAAIAGSKVQRTGRSDHAVSQVVIGFYKSAIFANLKPSSQRVYRIVLDSFVRKHGHRSVKDMPTHAIRKLIEEIGEDRPGMANMTRKVLHRLMSYVIKGGFRTDNPISAVDMYALGEHHCWTDAELLAYEKRWPLGTRERLAYALCLYTDQRVSDVARMRRQDIRAGAIHLVQEKGNRKGKKQIEMAIYIHPDLQAALDAYPVLGMSLIGDRCGRPITAKTLSAIISKAAREAGLSAECAAHGLRKAFQRLLSEHGATTKELQAVSGHASLSETERYTKAANQKVLAKAAILRLPSRLAG